MELKRYQADTLAVLRRFFEEARVAGPKDAYEAITREPEQAGRLGHYGGSYRPLDALPDAPYVCLRLPTGGGKTILAAHSIAVARDAWVERDWPMVLWLVPSNTIRLQTAEALKNARHFYRRVLDEAFGGRVRVFDIADFSHIRPHDVRDQCCVVVGTIQTLRVKGTEGRKVYAHNENMEPHFSGLAKVPPGLETLDGGGVKFSFANLMHIHRPLMIVDEAHNAVTGLTREMQARVNPCAIVEFTATPRLNSNILYNVSAQELKRAEMIKLPIALAEHDSWQGAVSAAVAARAALAEAAKGDRRHIRPVALFQAEPKDREVTVEVLKTHLVEVERVPAERIAIATGAQRELDGIDLFDPACKIEHIVTVQALKEGWDCSFAYVFCSVANIRSATDVEQLLGRVLRMPYAERRADAALNKAHAFVCELTFGAAARALVDKLVAMGFEETEARDNIEEAQRALDEGGGLFAAREKPRPVFRHKVAAAARAALANTLPEGAAAREAGDGTVEIAVTGWVSGAAEAAIRAALPAEARDGFAAGAAAFRREQAHKFSPAERGERFALPALAAAVQGELALADTDLFMENHDWSLAGHSFRVADGAFSIRQTARGFEIDLEGGSVSYMPTGEEARLPLDGDVEGWTEQTLVLWLDRQLRAHDIAQDDLMAWLAGLVGDLTGRRGMRLPVLMLCKFRLKRVAGDMIAAIRRAERETVYQRHLFAPEARPTVSFDHGFAFRDGMYAGERRHRGRWKPARHFLGPDAVPAFDGAEGGEEMQCAQALDGLPGVRHWIRNVARHVDSFWLPTATDRFYPDFAAQLEDGRLLVVEYKGAHLAAAADTAEKRAIGELWERESAGRCLFAVVEKNIAGKDMRRQLLEKVGVA